MHLLSPKVGGTEGAPSPAPLLLPTRAVLAGCWTAGDRRGGKGASKDGRAGGSQEQVAEGAVEGPCSSVWARLPSLCHGQENPMHYDTDSGKVALDQGQGGACRNTEGLQAIVCGGMVTVTRPPGCVLANPERVPWAKAALLLSPHCHHRSTLQTSISCYSMRALSENSYQDIFPKARRVQDLHKNVHRSLIHNCPKLKTTLVCQLWPSLAVEYYTPIKGYKAWLEMTLQ